MSPPFDPQSVPPTAAFVNDIFRRIFPGQEPQFLETLFKDTERLFVGCHPDYAQIDLDYHDLRHTLQVTVCTAQIFSGYLRAQNGPGLLPRAFESGIAGALLHDTGYLKLRSDAQGTGAKYTYCHVLRSCAFAASYLPTLGMNEIEITGVLGAIKFTGTTTEKSRLQFRDPVERFIACAVASADYLGQMAAPDYPDKLEILYGEFLESDNFVHTPESKRNFKSAQNMIERTPMFWKRVVLPKLENDFEKVYRYLSDPYPQGPNSYVQAVEKNVATVERRLAKMPLPGN